MSDTFATLDQGNANLSIRDLSRPLAGAKGWMKFIGIMFIVQGAITAITIVGILIAWLPIWIGVLLLQSSGAIERAERHGDATALMESMTRLRTYFVILGVLCLVSIVIMVLYIVFFGAVIAAMIGKGAFH